MSYLGVRIITNLLFVLPYLVIILLLISGCSNCPSSICADREGVKEVNSSWIYCHDGGSYDRYFKEFR